MQSINIKIETGSVEDDVLLEETKSNEEQISARKIESAVKILLKPVNEKPVSIAQKLSVLKLEDLPVSKT
jgi:hypothetical protein